MSSEKTEEPTGKRLGEARSKGNIPQSPDLSVAVCLLVSFVLLYFVGMSTYHGLHTTMETTLQNLFRKDLTISIIMDVATEQIYEMAKLLIPILGGLVITALATAYLQTGFLFTTEPLKPNLAKLNFVANIKNLFSPKTFVKLLFSVVKLFVVSMVAYFYIKRESSNIMGALDFDLQQLLGMIAKLMYGLALRVASALLILAIMDFMYQKWQYKRGLRMSKEEVKEERKQSEGDPLIKGKVRSLQRQMAMKRMMSAVPRADVVVTNPTHYAVAIQYDSAAMKAPKVIAKGADLIAKRIKEIAKEHKIPLVEDKPLAQTLYKTVDLDKEIPQKLYYAVAKVLSYVYQMKKKAKSI